MKKELIILFILAFASMGAAFAANSDTVWTKSFWPESITNVLFSPDGTKIFVTAEELLNHSITGVYILDTFTGDTIRKLTGVGAVLAFSPDAKYIYTSVPYKLDASTYQVIASADTFGIDQFSPNKVAITGDGQYLIVSNCIAGPNQYNKNIAIISTDSMKYVTSLSYPEFITHLAATPDGKYFATASSNEDSQHYNESLVLWDAQTFQVVKELDRLEKDITINDLIFSNNSKYLSVATGAISIYDIDNLILSTKIENSNIISAQSLDYSKDDNFIVFGNGTSLKTKILELSSKEIVYEYSTPAFSFVKTHNSNDYILGGRSRILILFNAKWELNGIKQEIKKNGEVIIFPNPNDGVVNIKFNNETLGNVRIDIYSNDSELVENISNEQLETGEHTFTWNSLNYPSGIYFCRITSNNENITYKIITTK